MTDSVIYAIDRVGTVRTVSEDGHLTVKKTPISKATVNEYFGREIPNCRGLGLDLDTKYRLLRDPDELRKAAPTFNLRPILTEHIPVTSDSPQKRITVGSTGTDAVFEDPYLFNSLSVWDQGAIDKINDGTQRELSSCYRYDADMTPGTYQGQPYDGVMRNIRGNHVALVPEGRAGPDVLVYDSKDGLNRAGNTMKIRVTKRQREILRLLPRMAADSADCNKALDDALEDADSVGADESESNCDKIRTLLGQRVPDDILDQVLGVVRNVEAATDEDPEDKAAKDKAAKDKAAKDEEERKRKEDEAAKDNEPGKIIDKPAAKDEDKDMKKDIEAAADAAVDRVKSEFDGAMDAAVKAAIKRTEAAFQAKEDTRAILGNAIAYDSAEDIYGAALKKIGYTLDGIDSSAYGPMFKQHQSMSAKVAQDSGRPKAVLAADSLENSPLKGAMANIARIGRV